jgi:hypothetical protein
MSSKFYEVEGILDKKIIKGKTKYLIKWIGWPEEDSTWEPLENLKSIDFMINHYENNSKENLTDDNSDNLLIDKDSQFEEGGAGSLDCDIPKIIINAKMSGNEIKCLVSWNKRYDGSNPGNTYISNKLLREIYPQLLIEYYESKIVRDKKK